ncbi:tryptophan--tRNA ligase [Terricaulis silvestris]|uniref:Tryptophan--tRNA ligase n=1 Tax=Terricaulis silvestris TaxID=2686094 RepID=A0A6I6MZ90_9CAUL|nr:tryptophan--tRNA ligase [Terricaulis silvestris]QGZ96962.1 Tryptophan--tRNA ligase [Terricaulis silvestris]
MTDAQLPQYKGPQRVFSGMQPTNGLHLGNYLGALQKWVRLQDQYDCIYCVVDLHAITVDPDPATLVSRCREVAAAYIAAGVDPKRSIIFVQSAVREHTELTWIFNCVARMGWMQRMTQFKDKAGKHEERMSVGLFDYPVLMAADILVYKATHVPVGEDQKQHLELSRDIAQKFNNDFNAPGFFPLPEPLIQGPGARIMSLRDGTKKMSKSDPSDMTRINMTDAADAIMSKIKKATTDSLPVPASVEELKGRAEVENLVGIFAATTERTKEDVLNEFGGKGFGEFKPALAEVLAAKLSPIAAEMRRLNADPAALDAILKDGAEKARAIAQPIMAEVRDVVGFWRA